MIARFFALLMLFALAMPAAAMPLCHGDSEQTQDGMAHQIVQHGDHHNPTKQRGDAGEQHGCLACSAPLDHDSLSPNAPHWVAVRPIALHPTSLHGVIPTPEPPPPRA